MRVVPYEELALPEDYSDEDAVVTERQVELTGRLLEVPEQVVVGETLRYVVELGNESPVPVALDPCPVYYQAWGESSVGVSRISYLNCDAAPPEVPAGGSLRFEMKLPIRGRYAAGVAGSVIWYLGAPDGDLRGDLLNSGEVTAVRER